MLMVTVNVDCQAEETEGCCEVSWAATAISQQSASVAGGYRRAFDQSCCLSARQHSRNTETSCRTRGKCWCQSVYHCQKPPGIQTSLLKYWKYLIGFIDLATSRHQALVLDAACCYQCSLVCLFVLDTLIRPAKTEELLEMQFWMWTLWAQSNGLQGTTWWGPRSPHRKEYLLRTYLSMPAGSRCVLRTQLYLQGSSGDVASDYQYCTNLCAVEGIMFLTCPPFCVCMCTCVSRQRHSHPACRQLVVVITIMVVCVYDSVLRRTLRASLWNSRPCQLSAS